MDGRTTTPSAARRMKISQLDVLSDNITTKDFEKEKIDLHFSLLHSHYMMAGAEYSIVKKTEAPCLPKL